MNTPQPDWVLYELGVVLDGRSAQPADNAPKQPAKRNASTELTERNPIPEEQVRRPER